MITRSLALLLLGLCACSSDTILEDKPNATPLDDSSARWDDGPPPTPDPPLEGDGDGAPDAGEPETDAGSDAGTASDAGQDAGSSDGG